MDWMWKQLAENPPLSWYLTNDITVTVVMNFPDSLSMMTSRLRFLFTLVKGSAAPLESMRRWLSIFISLKPPPSEWDMKRGVNEPALLLAQSLATQIILIPEDNLLKYILSFSAGKLWESQITSHMGSVDPQNTPCGCLILISDKDKNSPRK